ncbi:MAG: hydroxyphenylacetyl-CoA thioesterase PaaI [Methylocystaceae bacterium]|nr:hydroxyphenylacetyl-CoA thioesterase PaaI [Methylocystaceae bacterium]
MTDQELATKTKEAMFKNDFKAHEMGIEITDIKPGYARATMLVKKSMLNGHGSTHGGTTFSLADTAFAYACNSHNKVTVAAGCDITFSAPSFEGDILTAEAKETLLNGRSGIYDVIITRGDGEVVALFRGRSRTIKGEVIKND